MDTQRYRPVNQVRFVTAAALFDGHDASINIMRRLLQASGVEVVHLGHNRSVQQVTAAAIQEDAQGIAVSSYQGGHVEYLTYMLDVLKAQGAGHIRVFAGGGGVILPSEIEALERYGIAKVFSPDDGRAMGLQGMIDYMVRACDRRTPRRAVADLRTLGTADWGAVARLISLAEDKAAGAGLDGAEAAALARLQAEDLPPAPVLGITGTGGAGKSSLTDELVRRYLDAYPGRTIAVLSIDPTKRKSGGALLGDRIRMNAIQDPRAYMRSLATRGSGSEISEAIRDAIAVVKRAGYDFVIVETSGIGQGGAAVVDVCDAAMYVMTSDFGAASQLEKIDMIDYADVIVINKFERRGSADALRDVRKQFKRSRQAFDVPDGQLPVFGTIASQFDDPGTSRLFRRLMAIVEAKAGGRRAPEPQAPETGDGPAATNAAANAASIVASNATSAAARDAASTAGASEAGEPAARPGIIPAERIGYLNEIVQTVRRRRRFVDAQVAAARRIAQLRGAKEQLASEGARFMDAGEAAAVAAKLGAMLAARETELDAESRKLLGEWPAIREAYRQDRKARSDGGPAPAAEELAAESLSGTRIPRVSLPRFEDDGELLRWRLTENLPGHYPYTAGVFPFKRTSEDPKRQFAGEGTPERTNRRFHYLCRNDEAKRLSTAFDSVTLYGHDPSERPDIFGKIGNSGVNVCTLDDMRKLYAGFDLCHPSVSVSMTINGPAPAILAMFMNAAIAQQSDRFAAKHGREPDEAERAALQAATLRSVRGTVQADILKEDQGQNTCIFSTEFALKMMGDIQQYFIDRGVRHYYSVSISGYHIAEAGANPVTQLAFTLANGFTYVEYYLSRGMRIDDFAPNLSFFFSNGLDPEYSVMGRVARRIWATVMKEKYGANERSQKLKYHIQTSGRSLHAQEMDFNDIRTTLQALIAIYDNCNSLHTNAYDEAVTTPTESSVRRAMAIQLIINREFGLAKNENPLQGAFIVEELTDLLEEAVLLEFQRIHDRGGVLGAMETGYQRGKIQDESLHYEHKKHSGEMPIVGVNTFVNPRPEQRLDDMELARSTEAEKREQIRNLEAFRERNRDRSGAALAKLKETARSGGNVFEALMDVVRDASLGQITAALYEVGGQYRRNM
ncbi:methylmalonyl-CoA mutase [Paenibacillus sp. UNC496MF]|uniref:methylmalonyl-CoA mutase family protein n=1 Tax=Paenibacillus sp. UNC496MF TaxID=1502753 RepID=UPI0008F1C463|nr:methylmalonyl-CoA mutase family protein [Paenibacillus sp. UNC496MF]SFI37568.1 methylmalonyl-CoA mutase [Paenibacillus sp. UNC496MF]